jgi:hypothetical protein
MRAVFEMGWLESQSDERPTQVFTGLSREHAGMVSKTDAKALAGIAAVMFGSGFSALYIDSFVASTAFGLLALAGGITIVEQLPKPDTEPAA